MKKLLPFILILICIVLAGIYLFIPANIKFSKAIFIKTKSPVVNRFLMDESNWAKWLPTDSVSANRSIQGSHTFRFKNYYYNVETAIMDVAQVSISNDKKSVSSLVSVIPLTKDSVAVEWKAEIKSGFNPIIRIASYKTAKELESSMTDILGNLKTFLETNGNAYGFTITEQQVVDTILISTKYVSDSFPSTAEIYSLITDLRKYISKEDARETNPPMLNITNDSNTYRTMVAIPVNKTLPSKDNYVSKIMIPGKILVAEVKGGDYTARHAIRQLGLYIDDNHLSSPAIPFESLITNRPLEPDTTKWVTKIYYPIY